MNRRSWIQAFVAMVCGLVVPKPSVAHDDGLAKITCYGPPQQFLVTAESAQEACVHAGIPKLGTQFTLMRAHGRNTVLTVVEKTVEQACQTSLDKPLQWIVTCEWKNLPDDGLTATNGID